ncbi:MAG: MATE family efflux transporter [Eubacteriales bacterium]|nr:MATE family efflux transporter [Eubacteriales bacterium]
MTGKEQEFKEKRTNKLATMPMGRLIVSISLPLMFSLFVQSLYNMVDSIFVARLSEEALSATSLASPIQTLMVAVSVGTGVGINSLLSRTLGAGKKEDASAIASNGLVLAILSCMIFMLFGLTLVTPFLRCFTDDEQLLSLGVSYLSICTIFSLGIFVATTAERLLQATGNTLLSMIAQVTGAVANCILDPIMIFGLFGCPAMGIKGAAIATVLGQWLAAAIAMALNLKLNHDIRFDFRHFKLRGDIILDIYKVGAPSMLVTGLSSVQTMILNKILLGFSATAVAFFGVFHKMQNFVQMPLNGLAQGMIPIVGYAWGAKRGDRIRDAFKITYSVGLIFMLAVTVVIMAFPAAILGLFSAGEAMLSLGVPALRILSVSFVFIATCSIISYMFTGMGNGMVNLCCTAIRALLPIPLVFWLAKSAGLGMVWYAIPFADILACALAVYMLATTYKKKIKPMM